MTPSVRTLLVAALAAVVLSPAGSSNAAAQGSYEAVTERQTNVSAFYYYVLPGESSITIYMLGSVGAPGLYEMSTGTSLGEVLALAGGPQIAPETEDQIIHTTVRVYRYEGPERQVAYEAGLRDYIQRPGNYPALEDDDLVEVSTVIELVPEKFGWRDAISVVTGVAAVALAIDRIATLF